MGPMGEKFTVNSTVAVPFANGGVNWFHTSLGVKMSAFQHHFYACESF